VRRLLLILLVPFLTIMCVEAWWEYGVWQYGWSGRRSGVVSWDSTWLFILASLSVLIYLPMIAWLSLWIGMIVRSPTRSILACLGVIVVWAGLAPLVFAMLNAYFGINDRTWLPLLLLSPASIIPFIEFDGLDEFPWAPWLIVALNFCWYAGITLVLRGICLYGADWFLGRPAGGEA